MHDEFWAPLESRLRDDGIVLVNDATFAHEISAPVTVHRIAATEIAAEVGSPLGGAMAMVGAFAALTGIVALESLVTAMRATVPSYRRQHVDANERALAAGWDSVERDAHPAWVAAASVPT
jgi:2-oxoglutarate ferredoxin oxidoreductase subunit gamma